MHEELNHMVCRDELDWLAFRYVSGELDAEASATFERQLAVDQSAREAVAAAVELIGAVSVVDGPARAQAAIAMPHLVPVVHRGPSWPLRVAWISVAAAACVAAFWLGRMPRQSTDGVTKTTSGSSELAVAWAAWMDENADHAADNAADESTSASDAEGGAHASLSASDEPPSTSSADSPGELPTELPADETSTINGLSGESFEAPDWMVAAVSNETKADAPGSEQGTPADPTADPDMDDPREDG